MQGFITTQYHDLFVFLVLRPLNNNAWDYLGHMYVDKDGVKLFY